MRHTVAHIDIDAARKALALDAGKNATQIKAILDRRGMEAQSALDAAMVRADFDDIETAMEYGDKIAAKADTFEVSGLTFDGSNLVEAFGWEGN